MLAGTANLNPVSKRAWSRLLVACALSLFLHVALLTGIPVYPAGGVVNAVSAIYARLEPAAPESAARSEPTEVALPDAPKTAASALNHAKRNSATNSEPAATPPFLPGAIDLPPMRDPTYYPARQLDVYPRALASIRLDYPAAAADARVDGQLLVLLLIDEFGVVNDASIVEAKPEGYFEEAALAALRAVRFSPAQKQGRPVKSRALLQINYARSEQQGVVR